MAELVDASALKPDNAQNRVVSSNLTTSTIMHYFYVSFVDETKEKFLGATIIEAMNPDDALERLTKTDYYPGGSALVLPVPEEEATGDPYTKSMIGRLVLEDEMLAQGAKVYDDLGERMQNLIDDHSVYIQSKPKH